MTGTQTQASPQLNFSTVVHEGYLNDGEKAILATILSCLAVLGFLGNVIVVFAIVRMGRTADVPANIFILSQAFADLATTAAIPIYISHIYAWNWDLVYVVISFVWISSLGSLFLLTFNRLVSVAAPLNYTQHMTPFRAKISVAFIWTAALLISLLHMIGHVVYSDGNFFNYGRYYIAALITGVILCNAYMFQESRKQMRKIRREHRTLTGLQTNLREDFKSVRTLALVGGTFLGSCLPITLVIFLDGNGKESAYFQRGTAYLAPLVVLNPVLDPLIYYLRSAEFRWYYERFRRMCERGVKADYIMSLSTLNKNNRVDPMDIELAINAAKPPGMQETEF